MKKLILISYLIINIVASAQEFNYEGVFYQILDQDAKTCTTKIGGEFTCPNGVDGELVLPAHPKFDGQEYTLTEIGDFSFQNMSSSGPFITSVTIPNTVQKIGDRAFNQQYKLKYVYIPGSVERIDYRAFTHCYELETITIDEGLQSTGYGVFSKNKSLKELVLPSTLREMDGFLIQSDGGNNNPMIVINDVALEKLICKSKEPPTVLNKNVPGVVEELDWQFEKLAEILVKNKNTILYVPSDDCKEKYLQAPGWKGFGDNIQEFGQLMPYLDHYSLEMTKGESKIIKGSYTYGYNPDDSPTDASWSSDNEDVAIVQSGSSLSEGIVTGLKDGKARITWTVTTRSYSVETHCNVIVNEGAVSFNIDETDIKMVVKEDRQFVINLSALREGTSTLTIVMTNEEGVETTQKCKITVTDGQIVGDLNGDYTVNSDDLEMMIVTLSSGNGTESFVKASDFNGDGIVNSVDLEMMIDKISTNSK